MNCSNCLKWFSQKNVHKWLTKKNKLNYTYYYTSFSIFKNVKWIIRLIETRRVIVNICHSNIQMTSGKMDWVWDTNYQMIFWNIFSVKWFLFFRKKKVKIVSEVYFEKWVIRLIKKTNCVPFSWVCGSRKKFKKKAEKLKQVLVLVWIFCEKRRLKLKSAKVKGCCEY